MIRTMPFFLLAALVAGCGGGDKEAKDRTFFTSGNREADQRAEQRMAKEQQLRGEGEGKNANKKSDSKEAKAIAATSPAAPTGKTNSKPPLFQRIGGEAGVNAIIDDFVTRALADPRVNWERKGVESGGTLGFHKKSMYWDPNGDNVNRLKLHLAQFMTLATGGTPKYEGKEMKEAHYGMKITNAEFDASIGDLKASLDKLGVATEEQKELLSVVESTRPQVVEER